MPELNLEADQVVEITETPATPVVITTEADGSVAIQEQPGEAITMTLGEATEVGIALQAPPPPGSTGPQIVVGPTPPENTSLLWLDTSGS